MVCRTAGTRSSSISSSVSLSDSVSLESLESGGLSGEARAAGAASWWLRLGGRGGATQAAAGGGAAGAAAGELRVASGVVAAVLPEPRWSARGATAAHSRSHDEL